MLSNETLIDIKEVANEFGKSVESIRKYKNFGIIRVSDKNGNKDLFDRSEILDIRIQLKELRLKGLTLSQIADEIESERKFENKTSPTFGPNSGSIVSQSHEGPLKILLADKDSVVRKTVTEYIEDLDYSICETTNGEETIAKAFTFIPDLILLDLQLPKIDGYQVCKMLKGNSTTQTIPIIVIAQFKTNADKINLIECGADDYVEKPLDKNELIARIKMVNQRALKSH